MSNEKNPGGRPRKVLTEDQLKQVEKLSGILTVDQLADLLCISKVTFYEIMERDPKVSELYKKGRAKVIGGVGQNLVQKALSGDNAAMMFYLKTQAGWKEGQTIDHTSSDGSMTPRVTLEDFYDE